jgi:hypothetical protein
MSYTSDTIINDKRANQIIDLIFEKLVEKFPPTGGDPDNFFVKKGFVLSGKASKMLQESTTGEIKNIIFETDKPAIYDFLTKKIDSFFKMNTILFQERILIYPFNIYIEIWKCDEVKAIAYNSIFVQDVTFIPTEAL